MQRAFSGALSAQSATATTISFVAPSVQYLDGSIGDVTQSVSVTVPLDASPHHILSVLADEIVAQQPTGFDLDARDVLLYGLERG